MDNVIAINEAAQRELDRLKSMAVHPAGKGRKNK